MVHKLIKNDLTTFPPYNTPILVKLKNKNYYVVTREEYENYDYNTIKDVFKEYLGEQFTYWDIEEVDSWMSFEDLNTIWDMNTPKIDNITKYKRMMKRYYNGEFGSEPMTLAEILEASKEHRALLENMSCEEVETLLKESTGMTKILFSHILELKKQGLYQ